MKVIKGLSRYAVGDVVVINKWIADNNNGTRMKKPRPYLILGICKDYHIEAYHAIPCTSKYSGEEYKVPLIENGVSCSMYIRTECDPSEMEIEGLTTYVCLNQIRYTELAEIKSYSCHVEKGRVDEIIEMVNAITFDRINNLISSISKMTTVEELETIQELLDMRRQEIVGQEEKKESIGVNLSAEVFTPAGAIKAAIEQSKKKGAVKETRTYTTTSEMMKSVKFRHYVTKWLDNQITGLEAASKLDISPSTFSRMKDKYCTMMGIDNKQKKIERVSTVTGKVITDLTRPNIETIHRSKSVGSTVMAEALKAAEIKVN